MHRAGEATEVFFDGVTRYALVRGHDAAGSHAAGNPESRHLTRLEARWALARALGPNSGADIVRAYRTLLPGPVSVADEADLHHMREALLAAVERGHLAVFETRLIGSATGRDVDDGEAAPPPAKHLDDKTWISIVLVDDLDPPRPVSYASYRVELADGSTREGMLDQNGRARLEGIDPGTCKVSFPGYDRHDWS